MVSDKITIVKMVKNELFLLALLASLSVSSCVNINKENEIETSKNNLKKLVFKRILEAVKEDYSLDIDYFSQHEIELFTEILNLIEPKQSPILRQRSKIPPLGAGSPKVQQLKSSKPKPTAEQIKRFCSGICKAGLFVGKPCRCPMFII